MGGTPLLSTFCPKCPHKVPFSWNRRPRAESCARAEARQAMRASVTELLNHASVDVKDAERRSSRRERAPPRSENPGISIEKLGSGA